MSSLDSELEFEFELLDDVDDSLSDDEESTALALAVSALSGVFAPLTLPPMLPPTAEEGEGAAAMQALAAVAEAEEAAGRSDQSGYEEPPSYEAAMGGNI